MRIIYFKEKMGNIQSKSDVSDKISYGEFGAGPNALTSLKNPASGFTPWPQHISYTAFNKVSTIIDTVENNDTIRLDLHYGFDNQRRKTILSQPGSGNKTKYFFGNYEIHNDDTGEKTFLFVNSPVGLCAIIESYEENQVPVQKVWHSYTDHLGSLVYLENADNSNETLEYSYDACSVKLCTGEATADDSALVELIPMRNEIGREILEKLMTGLPESY